MNDTWIYAIVAVVGGVLAGVIAGAWVRRWLSRPERRHALAAVAGPTSVFVFWLATATGVLVALAASTPSTLRPIPREIIDWLPDVLAAGLVLLAGYAIAIGTSASIARGFEQATGTRSRLAERTLRGLIIAGSIVLALGQLGVETTILIVLTAGAVLAFALSAALLTGLGGRDVARSIAAGRVLQPKLRIGQVHDIDGESLSVVELGAATVTFESDNGDRQIIAYALLLDRPIRLQREPDEHS
jgi:hypothetical protein